MIVEMFIIQGFSSLSFHFKLCLMKSYKQFVLFLCQCPSSPASLGCPDVAIGGLNLLMSFLQTVKHHKPFQITKLLLGTAQLFSCILLFCGCNAVHAARALGAEAHALQQSVTWRDPS